MTEPLASSGGLTNNLQVVRGDVRSADVISIIRRAAWYLARVKGVAPSLPSRRPAGHCHSAASAQRASQGIPWTITRSSRPRTGAGWSSSPTVRGARLSARPRRKRSRWRARHSRAGSKRSSSTVTPTPADTASRCADPGSSAARGRDPDSMATRGSRTHAARAGREDRCLPAADREARKAIRKPHDRNTGGHRKELGRTALHRALGPEACHAEATRTIVAFGGRREAHDSETIRRRRAVVARPLQGEAAASRLTLGRSGSTGLSA